MYKFPHLTNIHQARAAIRGREEFVEAHKDGYIVFNYNVNFEDTFPVVTDELMAIRRECRGLIFDLKGNVISRPYHKFFNVNERHETMSHMIDWSLEHMALEKLDGSFIRPFRPEQDILWGTKMGVTDVALPVFEFVKQRDNYQRFAKFMLDNNKTPVFEWCSRQQRIVVDYPVDRLVLTGARDMTTGEYMSYSDLLSEGNRFDIEVVRAFGNIVDFEAFLKECRELKGMEGYVIRFANGHMYKVKADEYCLLHKTLDKFVREKDFVPLIVDDKLDDVLPKFQADIVDKVTRFGTDFHRNVLKLSDDLWWQVRADWDNFNGSKKKFAEKVNAQHQKHSDIMFKMWDHMDADTEAVDGVENGRKFILDKIKKHCSTQTKLNGVRFLFGGINWTDYYRSNVDLDG